MSTTTPDSAPATHRSGEDGPPDPDRTLGELVTELPGALSVFTRHGLDFCCGGSTTLRDAAADSAIPLDELLAELAATEPGPAPDWATMGPRELVDHVESTHHAYIRNEIPTLRALAAKVASVHGGRHPELATVQSLFDELAADLLPHLVKEERMLFPAIRELDGATSMPWFPFGSTSGPISVMMMEHDTAGELAARLRAVTDGYRTPEDACGSYHALFVGLEAFEADLHLHVHKENNVLFPAARALEAGLHPAPA